MKIKLLILLATYCLAMACNNADTDKKDTPATEPAAPTTTDTVTAITTPVVNAACYTQVTDKDTVWLHLVTDGDQATGDLQYKLFEKDRNSGTITGRFKGDTLLADYRFLSEGDTSVREVAFLKKGNDYTEGFGMVRQKAGKTIFRPGTLRFSDSLLLRKVDCP